VTEQKHFSKSPQHDTIPVESPVGDQLAKILQLREESEQGANMVTENALHVQVGLVTPIEYGIEADAFGVAERKRQRAIAEAAERTNREMGIEPVRPEKPSIRQRASELGKRARGAAYDIFIR